MVGQYSWRKEAWELMADLSSLTIFPSALIRRAGERPLVESSVANGLFHTPGKFLDYAADGVDLTPFRLRRGLFSLNETRMVAGRLNATVAFDLKNPTGQVADVALQVGLTSAEGEVILTESTARVAHGTTQALTVPFALAKSGDYLLTLVAMSDGAVVLDAADAMPIRFVPLTIDVTRPFFRNNLYATEKLERVEATVKIGLTKDEITGATLRVFLKDGAGTQRAETTVVDPMLEQRIAFPAACLVQGENTLHATLTKGDKTMAETTVAVHKLEKAPGTEVRIDERLRMVVDGTPVLPIVWWGGATFEEIARTGSDGIIVGHSSNPRPQLDKLQAVGQKGCVVLMGGAMAKKIMYGRTEFTDEMRAYVRGVVTAVKDHPAMLCYYLSDEPEIHDVSADLLRAYYQTLRELAPYHPVLIANDSARGLNTYAHCHDMFVPDPYILPVKGAGLQRGMDYVVTFMETMRAAGKGRQLLGLTPQVFNYGDYGQHNGRAPSFVEQRCQQYLGIVSGVRFFSYYKYGDIRGYLELRIGVPELMKEIRAVTPVLFHGRPDATVTADKNVIHLAAWRYQGERYVIACNITPGTVEATLALSGAATVRVISEGRSVTINDGKLCDHFGPHDVHIYTTSSAFRSPITLSDLQRRIEKAGGAFITTSCGCGRGRPGSSPSRAGGRRGGYMCGRTREPAAGPTQGWNGGRIRWTTQHGYAVADINYRLSQETAFPVQICDCKTAIRWLRAHAEKYGYDPKHGFSQF